MLLMRYLVFIGLLLPGVVWSQSGSEILLCDVEVKKGQMTLTNLINITNHPGYDNQPSFHPDMPLVYYASFDDEGRSDIKIYDYKSRQTLALTKTKEREYSPTVTPDGQYVSCIIQRDDDAQDLGMYPVAGGAPTVLIDDLIVGYHAWANQDNLILFVLGEPLTLRWYNLKSKTDEILSENIGRSLHKIPKEEAMSFVQKNDNGDWMINRLDIQSKKISPIAATLSGREDMVWTPTGDIVMSDGSKLFIYCPKKNKKWAEIKIDSGTELKGITRLALSKDGKKMAIVVSE